MNAKPVLLSGLAAGAALTGFLLGRRGSGPRISAILRGNEKWMTPSERRLVRTLVEAGQGHLFSSWPPPGVRDGEKRALLRAALQCVSGAGAQLEEQRLSVLQPPVAAKRPKQLEAHGDVRVDEYYWLRDDARKDPAVLAHLEMENAHTRAVLADTAALQEALYTEMRARIQERDASVPVRHGGFFYYSRTEEGQQYKIHCRRPVPPGAGPPSEHDALDAAQPEQVLLDENQRKAAGGHEFYMVGALEVSPDQRLLAWAEDTVGGEKYTLHVKDLASGRELTPPIPNTAGDVVWANDCATLFYTVKDQLDRPYRVYRHTLGQQGKDVLVFEEADEAFYVGISRSRSEELLFISCGSAVTSEERVLRADDPTGEFRLLYPRQQDVEYSASHRGGHLFITQRDPQHPNSRLFVAPLDEPGSRTLLLDHRRDVKLEAVSTSRDFLVVFERARGQQRATVFRLPPDGSAPTQLVEGEVLQFEEPAYSLGPGSQGDFDSSVLRLGYTSLATPSSTIDHNMATGGRVTKKVEPVLGGFDAARYTTEKLWASAQDGTQVPISLVYRKGMVQQDGSAPLLLNGYGSYEIPNDPWFSRERLSLLDRGWVFAIAHVRGGGDMGRYWYEDGKFLCKKNTFTDFIACAEHLVALRFTSSSRLCIEGRSAGGLLMGAVLNMRPDLFSAAILGVPFVDALTTMLDDTIPLTIIEREEWGDPQQREYYDYMRSYAPVDNVAAAAYPHMLVTAGLHDPRVGYWEPAKLVAKLREHSTNQRAMLLLKCDMGAGHFSVTGRFERLREKALEFAFLLKSQHSGGSASTAAAAGAGGEGQGWAAVAAASVAEQDGPAGGAQ